MASTQQASLTHDDASIRSIMLQDIVGDYENPESVAEWAWIEREASYRHMHNGQDGIWEFILNLSLTWDNIPTPLRPVIEQARADGKAYLLIHQGT